MDKVSVGLMTMAYLLSTSCTNVREEEKSPPKYNVFMIIVDDQKPLLGSYVQTPNFDRLSKEALFFNHAYCNAPACGPSRASFLTGLHPSTSGVYYNNQNFREAEGWVSEVVDLPGHFKNNGYLTANFGKTFHHGGLLTKESFTDGYFYGQYHSNKLKEEVIEVTDLGHIFWSFGPLPDEFDREDTARMQIDTRNTNRAIDLLQQDIADPFFISLGVYKPHGPWYSAQRYFDMYPIEDINIPDSYLEDDLDDLPEIARMLATHRGWHKEITERNLWEKTLQAYYASITYADEQLGRVLDALENSQYANNTIIVFFGDNGFHTGEKNSWSKFKLWDLATRVPMMIALPGDFPMSGKVYGQPVSLLDIYPTLVELCKLPNPGSHDLDGSSLLPVLKGNDKYKRAPVISTWGRKNHAVIGEDYYYISYRNGSEELYNMDDDMYQWRNLANDKAYRNIIDSLSYFFPKVNAEAMSARPYGASFDPFQ